MMLPDASLADMQGKRLIAVANRLLITITQDASGEYHIKMSSGGQTYCRVSSLPLYNELTRW